MFDVAIQANAIGSQIIQNAVKAMRKDVLAKCYGWFDVSRKKNCLKKTKAGKKRMKQVGDIPQAFLAVLKVDSWIILTSNVAV